MSDDVIDFEKAKKPVDLKARGPIGSCQHKGTVFVDTKIRIIECGKCGVILDPIQVLIEMANGYRAMDYKLRRLEELEEKEKIRSQKAKERREAKKARNSERP
jgi:hypothetical protein